MENLIAEHLNRGQGSSDFGHKRNWAVWLTIPAFYSLPGELCSLAFHVLIGWVQASKNTSKLSDGFPNSPPVYMEWKSKESMLFSSCLFCLLFSANAVSLLHQFFLCVVYLCLKSIDVKSCQISLQPRVAHPTCHWHKWGSLKNRTELLTTSDTCVGILFFPVDSCSSRCQAFVGPSIPQKRSLTKASPSFAYC